MTLLTFDLLLCAIGTRRARVASRCRRHTPHVRPTPLPFEWELAEPQGPQTTRKRRAGDESWGVRPFRPRCTSPVPFRLEDEGGAVAKKPVDELVMLFMRHLTGTKNWGGQ